MQTIELQVDRRSSDRRARPERRSSDDAVFGGPERRKAPRRKAERRRQIDPTTCERDYSIDEVEFMNAMDEYKRKSGRMFPTCSEVLEVVRELGYVKLSPAGKAMLAANDLHAEDAALEEELAVQAAY